MARVCPTCGAESGDEARFCSACATPLGEPGPSRKERKLATALFADVVGSTALAEREDAEVVQAVLERAFTRAQREIERHGGLLEKFIGDAILAVFGVPVAHEDDPERAVRAAIAVQAEIEALARELETEGRSPLALRIGIEAGEVLVDVERVAGPRHRMLTGDAVNTAARLEQAAGPGRILVGPVVRQATDGTIEYQVLPPLDLKGKAEPVMAWEVVRAKTAPQGQRAPLRLEARLVGRQDDLAWLAGSLDRVGAEGGPRLVTVLGPAGIGKSRLAHEFLQRLEHRPEAVTVRRGRCLAYGNISYSALAEIMKAECGVLDDDPSETVAAKASATLERLLGGQELSAHLEALIGSSRDHRFGREDLFDAWRRILERMAAPAALILVLEDLHWADDGLLDLVEHVAAWARAPILLLALARPDLLERRPAWGDGRAGEAMVLEPLSGRETEAMLEDLLAVPLPPELGRVVLETGEGNPLFCEEIVRMLVDRGVIRPGEDRPWTLALPIEGLEVPRTIHALLSARLDSLAGEEKAILQDAAVMGRTFWAGALGRLSDLGEDRVLATLVGLRGRGFIEPREPSTLSGVREFAFHHALIRDVAYESLPKALRIDKHVATARWAEEQAGGRSEEIAELLATHHLQALRWLDELGDIDGQRHEVEEGGFRWSRIAGERARRLWQQHEAVRWLRAALDLGGRTGREDGELAEVWESYALAADGVEPHDEVARAWEEALARYDRLGRAGDVGRAEASLAYASIWVGQASEALDRARQAVERLEPLGESADLAFALFVLGRHELEHGAVDRAEPLLRRARAIAGRLGDRPTEAIATISLGWALHARRRGDETVRLFDDALETARRAGDLSLLLDALEAVLSAAVEVSGDFVRAEALCLEAVEVSRRAGNLGKLGRAQLNLGYLHHEVGRLDEVDEPLRVGREAATAVGDPTVVAWTHAMGALTSCVRGEPQEARTRFDAFQAVLRGVDVGTVPYLEEICGLVAGYVAMGQGRQLDAVDDFVDAVGRVSDERLSVWFGQLLLFECVRSLVEVGRRVEAVDPRDRLAGLAVSNVPPRAFVAWADGLLAEEPEVARRRLDEAAGRLEALGRRIDLGRCLLDLGAIERRLGPDGQATMERGRELLRSCGAHLFLRTAPVPAWERAATPSPGPAACP